MTLFLMEGGENHPSWFQGPFYFPCPLLSRTFQFGARLNCAKYCLKEGRERKSLVKMHLLDHVLNEVQSKVVFVHRKEKPLQMR